MRRGFIFAVGFAVLLHAVPTAQQATTNINVLPAHVDPADPSAFLKGDLFMQRQVEPAMAASTRNPDHLMVFYNDYRAVDIGNDFGVGEQVASRSILARLLARVFRLPRPERTRTRAAAEAFVGYSVSYDRGVTWSGGLIPGSPKDLSTASLASPIRGVEAATDPVVASAPCGYIYVAYVGFTRGPGGKSYLAVSRYQDRNNTENGDDIQYLDTKVLATASNDNPTLDTFVDKPAIGIDIDGPGSTSEACHHHAYVAYTVFDGPETSAGFKSRIMVARSPDSGGSWLAPVKVSGAFAQNQGAAVAVTPSDTPGHIYVGWRQFKTGADAIVLTTSHDFGETWDPAKIISGSPLATFDQPSIGKPEPAFRTNGFPTLAVASNGRVFAAWQERVGFADCASNGPQCGRPAANGSPRVVLMRSIDEGATWTDDRGAVGKRRAVDFGDRCEAAVQPDFGTVGCRASGPQVMPRLSTGAGRLMLTFYEARGELSGPAPGFIAGLNRRVDFRYAQLNASNGRLIAGAQVSRYDIRADANLADGEDETDLVQVAPGIPAVNRTNGLTSNAGTQPFLGDYTDLIPPVQFVNTNAGWRFATTPRRAGGTGFFTAFGDNRYQIPPTTPATLPVPDRYPFYSPPGTGMASCINPGSRNTDIITSQLSADLVVGAPVTFKELANIQRSFPIYVSNRSNELRFFRLTITRGVGIASFDQVTDVNIVDAAILPQSGVVRTVYVNPTRALTNAVSVEVAQIDAIGGAEVPGGLTGGITLNADPSTEPAGNPLVSNTETHNPLVSNNGAPLVSNYTVNPLVSNISKNNPLVSNPLVSNQTASAPLVSNSLPPDQDVYGITDVTWEVQNAGNTASSYLSLIDLPNGIDLQQFYKFQLTIFRRSYRATVDDTCTVTNVGYDQVIANVPNPLVSNDLSQNPLVSNPLVSNPLVSNSTFAEVPSSPAGQPVSTDGTTRAPRQPDRVFINLRGFKIVPQVPPDLVFGTPQNLPRLAVIAQERNIVNGVREVAPPAAYFAPDLALVAEAPPSFTPSTVVAGGAGELDGAVMANVGNAAAVVPNDAVINDRVFLSSDNVLDGNDIPLATGASFGTLQPGQSVAIGARPVVIPPVAAGNYFILRQVDANLLVSESNERNNISATPITVLSGAAAGSLHFETQPRDGVANQAIVPPMTVRARDAQGAVVPNLAVRLLLNTGLLLDKTSVPNDVSGTAELVGQTTVVTDVSGLATFSGLAVNRPAIGYSIVAAADGALSRTSTLFDMIQPEAVSCGTASFSVSPRLAMGDDPRSIALGDFNGDGRPDIVTANRQSNDVSVRLGQPEGSFGEPTHIAVLSAPLAVAVADFNADGFSDVFVISADSANILRGTPTGDLTPPTAVEISDGSASVTTGDFNQDGRADVAIAGTNGDGGGRIRIVLGNGSGGFLPQVTISLSADNPSAIKAADLNGDSRRDLVIANAAAGTVEVLFGQPGGTFSEGSTYPAGTGPVAVALGDLNGDRKPDIVTSTSNGVAVLLSQVEGGFTAFAETSLGSDSRGVALGDFNGDGRLDVASANGEGFTLLAGDGGGGLLPPQSLDPNFEPRGLAAGDLDGDHRLDIVVVNGSPSNGVTILRNTCVPGPRTLVVTNTRDSGAGSLRQAILEANANPFPDTIRFRIGNGGLKTIVLASPLPTVIDATNIDGTTQPGYKGAPLIELTKTAGFLSQGLMFESDGNTVRGLVINSFGNGILMFGNNNVVQGNYLGTSPAGGPAPFGNLIGITCIGANNLIGGSGAGRNVASGNVQGIVVGGSGTTVQNNFVGTDVTGTMALANSQTGIQITGSGHHVINNLTSNNSIGIFAAGSGHSITGNLIGTDVTGTLRQGNGDGIRTDGASGITIGGSAAAHRNIISGNNVGVILTHGGLGPSQHNTIEGNYVGTDITGQAAIGNMTRGIVLGAGGQINNTVRGNTIAYNGSTGVEVTGGNNLITRNLIFSNAALGIDINGDGVTANDPLDGDLGPNGRLNFPVVTSAVNGTEQSTIQGTINSKPKTPLTIELFTNPSCDPSGHGEGQTFLRDAFVVTDASGNASFNVTLPGSIGPLGSVVTAAARSAAEGTSEFSACRSVSPPEGSAVGSLPPGTVNTVSVDRTQTTRLYAATTNGVYKSTNRGQSWSWTGLRASTNDLVIDPADASILFAATNFGVFRSADGAQTWQNRGVGCSNTVASDPVTPSILYAGTCGWGLYKSTDRGLTWQPSGLTSGVIMTILVDPANPNIVYAAGNTKPLKSTDAGQTWQDAGAGLTINARKLVFDPSNSNILYAADGLNVYRSSNGAQSWSVLSSGFLASSIVVAPTDPLTLFASNISSVFKSTNGGAEWVPINSGLPATVWLSNVSVDPADASFVYMGTFGHGAFKSTNGGNQWAPASAGVNALGIVAVIPDSPGGSVYAATRTRGMFRSDDGGGTWTDINAGLSSGGFVNDVLADPFDFDRVYTVMNAKLFRSTNRGVTWTELLTTNTISGPAALDPSNSMTLYVTSIDKLFKSTDGGNTWVTVSTTVPPAVARLAVHPTNPQTLFMAGLGGVFKSVDGGQQWNSVGDFSNVRVLAMDRNTPGHVYVAMGSGLFRSTDNGITWTRLNLNAFLNSFHIHPMNSATLFAGAVDGIFRSIDAGATWSPVSTGLEDTIIDSIHVVPTIPSVVYVGTQGGGVFKSSDGGTSWQRVGGS